MKILRSSGRQGSLHLVFKERKSILLICEIRTGTVCITRGSSRCVRKCGMKVRYARRLEDGPTPLLAGGTCRLRAGALFAAELPGTTPSSRIFEVQNNNEM